MNLEEVCALLESPSAQSELAHEELKRLLFASVLLYGMTCDVDLIPNLSRLYELITYRVSLSERSEVYGAIREQVETPHASVSALLPFMMEDPEPIIASTAALDFAVLCPVSREDPMSGTRVVLGLFESRSAECPIALYGGLLYLGDRRVNRLLSGVRDTLSREELKARWRCVRTFCTLRLWSSIWSGLRTWKGGSTTRATDVL